MTELLIVLVLLMSVITVCSIVGLTVFMTNNKERKRLGNIKQPPSNILSFDDINEIIATVAESVFHKYEFMYTTKSVYLIPKMDEEIKKITKEIMSAFSDNVINNILMYYTKAHLYKITTRMVYNFLMVYMQKTPAKNVK